MTATQIKNHPKKHEDQLYEHPPIFPTDDTFICTMHAKKAVSGNVHKHAVGNKIEDKDTSLRIRDHMAGYCKIELPKSHIPVRSKREKGDWQRAPTLQAKEDDKLLEHFMSIYDIVEDQSNVSSRVDIEEACLDALIEWRNIAYVRIPTKLPTSDQLRHSD